MKTYEGIFVFPPVQTPEEKKASEKKVNEIVGKFGGKIIQRLDWGRRPLGYMVKKFSEGCFELVEVEMEPGNVDAFRKNLQLLPELVKFSIFAKNYKLVRNAPPQPKAKNEATPESVVAEG